MIIRYNLWKKVINITNLIEDIACLIYVKSIKIIGFTLQSKINVMNGRKFYIEEMGILIDRKSDDPIDIQHLR